MKQNCYDALDICVELSLFVAWRRRGVSKRRWFANICKESFALSLGVGMRKKGLRREVAATMSGSWALHAQKYREVELRKKVLSGIEKNS